MTEVQAVLIRLLGEIDEICLANGLKYWLTNEAALSAFRDGKFMSETTVLDIAMLLDDAKKLRECILRQARSDRFVDSIYDNDYFPYFIFHYGDTGTTHLNLRQCAGFSHNCICVKIKILRVKPKKWLHYLESAFEKGWIYNHENYVRRSKLSPLKLRTKQVAGFLIRYARRTYKQAMIALFERSQGNASTGKYLRMITFMGKSVGYKAGTFSRQKLVYLEGQPCFIAGNYSQYFRTFYGSNWRKRHFDTAAMLPYHLIDARMPFEALQEALAAEKLEIPSPTIFKGEAAASAVAKPLNREINKAWLLAQRSGARYVLWEEYRPVKDELLNLRAADEWAQLADLMKDYDLAAQRFLKDRLGLCFDEEIFQAYLDLLHRQGRDSFAKKLVKYTPDEHRYHSAGALGAWSPEGPSAELDPYASNDAALSEISAGEAAGTES